MAPERKFKKMNNKYNKNKQYKSRSTFKVKESRFSLEQNLYISTDFLEDYTLAYVISLILGLQIAIAQTLIFQYHFIYIQH